MKTIFAHRRIEFNHEAEVLRERLKWERHAVSCLRLALGCFGFAIGMAVQQILPVWTIVCILGGVVFWAASYVCLLQPARAEREDA